MGTLALASCTSGPGDADLDPDPAPLRAAVSTPEDRTSVIGQAGPVERTVATSAALYDHAPVVLLAAEDEPGAQARAASAAVELGAPLLLTPPVPRTTEAATTQAESTTGGTADTAGDSRDTPEDSSEPDEASVADNRAVRHELQRLDPVTVVTFGDGASAWASGSIDEELDAVSVVPVSVEDETPPAGPAESGGGDGGAGEADGIGNVGSLDVVPDVEAADPLDSLLVLVSDEAEHGAALATARASGARVLAVGNPDPRTDPDTIVALAEQPSQHVLALGSDFGSAQQLRQRLDVAETGVELPGGGQVVFPGRRFVALYGHPHNTLMGALGQQPLAETIERARGQAAEYEPLVDEPVIPALEIIATVAAASPGDDGNYSNLSAVEDLRPWVDAAAEGGVYVVLDLQPGRTDFLTQAQLYEELLVEPHVGLALDPEWRLAPDQVHLQQIGTVDAAEVNSVIDWLAELTRERKLPQKLLVLHQFQTGMITDRDQVDTGRDEVAVLIHADGFGTPNAKFETWDHLHVDPPPNVWWGWKNFLTEDSPTFTPAATVAIDPSPLFVSYQ